jgi:antitoxin HicB
LVRAVDALETMLMQPIPRPRRAAKGKPERSANSVALPALTEAKIELYTLMREQGIGKAELARRLHCHLPRIDRLLDLKHASRLDQLEQAFAAVGKRLGVAIADAHEDRGIMMDAATHNISIEIGARVDAAGSLGTPAELMPAPEKLG